MGSASPDVCPSNASSVTCLVVGRTPRRRCRRRRFARRQSPPAVPHEPQRFDGLSVALLAAFDLGDETHRVGAAVLIIAALPAAQCLPCHANGLPSVQLFAAINHKSLMEAARFCSGPPAFHPKRANSPAPRPVPPRPPASTRRSARKSGARGYRAEPAWRSGMHRRIAQRRGRNPPSTSPWRIARVSPYRVLGSSTSCGLRVLGRRFRAVARRGARGGLGGRLGLPLADLWSGCFCRPVFVFLGHRRSPYRQERATARGGSRSPPTAESAPPADDNHVSSAHDLLEFPYRRMEPFGPPAH